MTLAINKGSVFSSFDVDAFEVPSGRDEAWRFTPLRRLRGLHDGTAAANGVATVTVSAYGETVGRADPRLGAAGAPSDRVAAQAYSGFSVATVLDVPNQVEVTDPINVVVTGPGVDRTAYGHLHLRLGALAKATVVVDYRGSGTYADNVEFVLGDGAQLTVVLLQDWADDAVHHSTQHAKVGRDATLKHVAVSFGGDVVRHDFTAEYAGPGGAVEALGLYFADAGQHIEHRLFVDHTAPKTRSHVVYKGALQGEKAHAVWIGNVLIRKVAEGIETYEENRNLVLTDGCQADSVPNLEIETGEIEGAGHASATGRFDDEQLFYLRSRGIDETEARRLVIHGFFHDLIRRIDVPALEDQLVATVEDELAKTVGGGDV